MTITTGARKIENLEAKRKIMNSVGLQEGVESYESHF
jgi:hypothetical protein